MYVRKVRKSVKKACPPHNAQQVSRSRRRGMATYTRRDVVVLRSVRNEIRVIHGSCRDARCCDAATLGDPALHGGRDHAAVQFGTRREGA